MFKKAQLKSNVQPRAVVIELRDGRTLRGRLQLEPQVDAAALLARAKPFLTIRTPKGDIAINRDMISALMLGDEGAADTSNVSRSETQRNDPGAKPAPRQTVQPKSYDPCRILRVHPGASADELKTAWRERIRQCHPDRVRGSGHNEDVVLAAQREAALVNAAYQTLSGLRGSAPA